MPARQVLLKIQCLLPADSANITLLHDPAEIREKMLDRVVAKDSVVHFKTPLGYSYDRNTGSFWGLSYTAQDRVNCESVGVKYDMWNNSSNNNDGCDLIRSSLTFYSRDEWQRKFILPYHMHRAKIPPGGGPLIGCVVSIDMFNEKVQKKVYYLLMMNSSSSSYSSACLGEGRLCVPGLCAPPTTRRCFTGRAPPRNPS